MKNTILVLSIAFASVACVPDKSEITVSMNKKSKSTLLQASISSVQIINHQLVINGNGLGDVTNVKVDGNSLSEKFSIESKSATKIIANSISAFSFDISKVFNVIISNANASATFPIDFSLCNATLNGKGFNCAAPVADKDVLAYDAISGTWKPRPASGLNYLGTFNASTNPGAGPAIQPAGAYYIISDDGTIATVSFAVGDWLVSNGSTWQKIDNSSAVLSVHGRHGTITAQHGDYTLDLLGDVSFPTAPVAGKVLKFDGVNWVAGDDLSGGGAGSVTTSSIAAGAVTDAKIDTVSASKITGTITSAQIADGTIVNADISAAAAIDYSKLNIANGEIPAAKISGLPVLSTILAASITDGDTTHAPDGNSVFNALSTKLDKTGGTITGMINVPPPVLDTEATTKLYVDTADNLKLNKSGGTVTGILNLDSDLKIKGGTNYVTIRGHASSAAYNLILPSSAGTSGYVLRTDGSGNLSWVDPSAVSTGTSTVDSASIIDGSIVNADISATAAIAQSKIANLTSDLASKQATGNYVTALTGDVTATGPGSVAATVATVGGVTAANIATGTNLANAATNVNTANTIVKRDASGNFNAGTITATLNGVATNVSGTVVVANGGTGKTTLALNNLLFGNGTAAVGTLATTAVPSVLLSTVTTGAPEWTTSTAGNVLKGSVAGVQFGALSSTDLPAGTLSGAGTVNYIPYYNTTNTLANSPMTVQGSNVGVGVINPTTKLDVNGTIKATAFVGDGSGITGIAASAGGLSTEIQFNNSGVLGGSSYMNWNGTGRVLQVGITPPSGMLGGWGGGVSARNLFVGDGTDAWMFWPSSGQLRLSKCGDANCGSSGEQLIINGTGSTLDVKGILRLSGSTSGYVGLASAAAAGSTTYTLPATQGTAGQVLSTNGVASNATLSWITPASGSLTLTGDVTATGSGSIAATVAQVGGVTAANVATGANLANAATNLNTASTIVKRDASGNFAAGTITGTLIGNATNVTGVVAVANGGTGKSTLGLNNLLFGNTTSAIGEVASTTTPSVLLSANATGLPTWTTSTAGNVLKGSVTGVVFGPLAQSDLPAASLSGSGVANYVPYYTAASTLAISPMTISGSNVGVGGTSPTTTLDINGALTIRGMAAPAVSPAFQGRIYYDSATNKYRVSQNGGAYVDLVSGAGSADIDGLTDGVANSANGQLFLGTNAGAANSGLSNTGVGQKVMQANTSGFQNSAFGNEALSKNTTGGTNAAFGMFAMKENTTGNDNTSFGEQTLNSNQGGSENTAIGRQALYGFGGLSTHGKNTALGYRAGVWISTGSNNTFLGHTAGDNVTTGSSNIVIGYNVDAPSATASNQMTIGNMIYATGVNGTGTTVSTGSVGIGIAAPGEKLSVAGTVQSTVGGFKFPDGSVQSAAYTTRLTDISAGIVSTCPMAFNNAVVYSAPTNWTCTIDLNGLSNATNGSSGQFATQLRWGYAYNYPTTFAIEQSSDSSTWTTISASNNTGVQLLSPSVLRYVRLRSIDANGFSNLAGVQIMGGPTGINWASDAPAYVLKETWRTVNGNILIGPGKVGIGTTSPAVALDVVGDIQYTGIITDVSDRRLKKNLSPLERGLEIIRKIKTYSYIMKDDPKERVEYGVIAQDLQKIDPNLVRIADINKGFLGVNYMGLIPYTINAIQDVDNETKNLRVENEKLKMQLKNIEDLQRIQNQKLEKLIKRMGIKSDEI